MAASPLKTRLAGALLDGPRYALMTRGISLGAVFELSWIDICNRHERLVRKAGQRGVVCDWNWTSDLFFPKLRHEAGRRLIAKCLKEWPARLSDGGPCTEGGPEISFIVGHRGEARVPHLIATLSSLAAQEDARVECIVVEQAERSALGGRLPEWVRHLLTPPPSPTMPYSRSWAFNIGARSARGRILVFHDNDVISPVRYAAELKRIFAQGFEAARLQRFVFHVDESDTAGVFETRVLNGVGCPLAVVQNCEGHSVAVARDVYFSLGGHDEGFLGWGGEDNEFFDRLRTARLHDSAYLPFVHLWHPPAPGKGPEHPNTEYFIERMGLEPRARIRELAARLFGELPFDLTSARFPTVASSPATMIGK